MLEKYDSQTSTWIEVQNTATLVDGDRVRLTTSTGSVIQRRWRAAAALHGPTVHQAKLQALYLHAKTIIEKRERWYAEGERYLWPEIEAEAVAFQANNANKGRNLLAREALGLSAARQVAENTAAANALVGLVAAVIVNRTVHKDAIQALMDANNLAAVQAYDFSGGWPAL